MMSVDREIREIMNRIVGDYEQTLAQDIRGAERAGYEYLHVFGPIDPGRDRALEYYSFPSDSEEPPNPPAVCYETTHCLGEEMKP